MDQIFGSTFLDWILGLFLHQILSQNLALNLLTIFLNSIFDQIFRENFWTSPWCKLLVLHIRSNFWTSLDQIFGPKGRKICRPNSRTNIFEKYWENIFDKIVVQKFPYKSLDIGNNRQNVKTKLLHHSFWLYFDNMLTKWLNKILNKCSAIGLENLCYILF